MGSKQKSIDVADGTTDRITLGELAHLLKVGPLLLSSAERRIQELKQSLENLDDKNLEELYCKELDTAFINHQLIEKKLQATEATLRSIKIKLPSGAEVDALEGMRHVDRVLGQLAAALDAMTKLAQLTNLKDLSEGFRYKCAAISEAIQGFTDLGHKDIRTLVAIIASVELSLDQATTINWCGRYLRHRMTITVVCEDGELYFESEDEEIPESVQTLLQERLESHSHFFPDGTQFRITAIQDRAGNWEFSADGQVL